MRRRYFRDPLLPPRVRGLRVGNPGGKWKTLLNSCEQVGTSFSCSVTATGVESQNAFLEMDFPISMLGQVKYNNSIINSSNNNNNNTDYFYFTLHESKASGGQKGSARMFFFFYDLGY